MNDTLKITNESYPALEYLQSEYFSNDMQNKLDVTDIIAIPQKYVDGEFYFAQETVDFIKFCRQNDDAHSFEILSNGDLKIRSLHSFDIWMPIIQIAGEALLSVAIGLVTNYIYDKLKGREKEEAKVDITMVVKRKGEDKTIHYNGDAKTFKETFEKIDLNKM